MAFLAQLRLDEISPAAPEGSLPTKGLLLVFVDLEPDGGYPANENAVHAEIFEDTSLKRAAWPKHLVDELRFGVAAIVPEPFLSLPSLPPDLTVDDAAWSELLDAVTPRPPHHRMLGYPYSIQEQEAPVDEHGEFTLLLQLDGDGICGMSFGDGGSLQFWVPQGSLARSDLSGCVVGLDSY